MRQKPGQKHGGESMADTPDDAILARLENKAIHYLGRYASTEMRLAETLRRFARRKLGDIEPGRLNRLIDAKTRDCVRRGYVDDAAYAEVKAAALRRGGASRRAIMQKLGLAGCSREVIDEAIARLDEAAGEKPASDAGGESDLAEKTAALTYARRRRLGAFANPARLRDGWEARHLASLARAGFGYATARFVLDFKTAEAVQDWLATRPDNGG